MSMNTCVLMAEVIKAPEVRHSQDNLAIAEMLVQIPGLRDDDPPATLKAVMFGDRGAELPNKIEQGDRIILEGSLRMDTIERQEGFKEKRAELRLSQVHALDGTKLSGETKPKAASNQSPKKPPKQEPVGIASAAEPDLTDIPF